jgi:hypothetical protein
VSDPPIAVVAMVPAKSTPTPAIAPRPSSWAPGPKDSASKVNQIAGRSPADVSHSTGIATTKRQTVARNGHVRHHASGSAMAATATTLAANGPRTSFVTPSSATPTANAAPVRTQSRRLGRVTRCS